MEYTLIRSWRRTLSLSLKDDGTLLVRAPRLISVRHIEEFIHSKETWIKAKQAILSERHRNHPPKTELELKEQMKKSYSILLPLVEKYAARMGVRPTAVRVTRAEKRFGSCSSKNSLCFSLFLMEYPDEAIDYVIVHELSHILHHDHSKHFWANVAHYMPDYKRRRALLKQ